MRLSSEHKRSLLVALLYALIVGLLSIAYIFLSPAVSGGPLMPVDDAYIHFQFARQAAEGHSFVYNPGQPPSSGATSLLYPFLLAAGYRLGFTGLNLGVWAVALGVLATVVSALAVRAYARCAGLQAWLSELLGAAVAAWGTLLWHATSGMETPLVVAFALLTLLFYERAYLRPFVLAALALALLRPEASFMAAAAAAFYALRLFLREGLSRGHLLLLIPFAAVGLQPILNLALTGSANASGGQAKSLLGIIPFDLTYVVGRIADNVLRAWAGFLIGFDRSGLWTLPPFLGLAALAGLVRLARLRPFSALLPFTWLLLIFGAISTLDTAIWHFLRYHLPLLALAFPLSAYAFAALSPRFRWVAVGGVLAVAAGLNILYVDLRRENVESIAAQPYAMALWLSANTPPDSLVAVHDVGLIRYLGDRETLDLVGLTSAGMADAWRSGPGALAEALIHAPRLPDLFAAYDTARGLSYLADSIYGQLLAGFPHQFNPATNVALGGVFQGIYRPDWLGVSDAAEPHVAAILAALEGLSRVDMLNVAYLPDERAHDYRWNNTSRFDGFATEVYRLEVPGCSSRCRVVDGGRRLNGSESFVLAAQPGADHILVSRYHAPDGGTIRITVNDAFTIERTLPALPGLFVEIPTLIPAQFVSAASIRIRVEPVAAGALIFPFRHWLFAGAYEAASYPTPVDFQRGAIGLTLTVEQSPSELVVGLDWLSRGAASGDLIAFVHLYQNLAEPPIRQVDQRPGGGALPPGAWLPGVLSDRVVLDLSELAPGTYALAVGLYSPLTFQRLEPAVSAPYRVDESRVIVGEIVVGR